MERQGGDEEAGKPARHGHGAILKGELDKQPILADTFCRNNCPAKITHVTE